MSGLDAIRTPALLVDLDVLERNIARMATRARELGVALRPHVKTHKCIEIARLQRDAGARGFTVSTLDEARALAAAGFDDLLWAFPVIASRIPEAIELAARVRLGVAVDSLDAVSALVRAGAQLGVWLEIDSGQHRSGVAPSSPDAEAIVRAIASAPGLSFGGLFTHAGHSYACRGGAGLAEIAALERDAVVGLAERLRTAGLDVPGVSVGSTPTMSAATSLDGATEARPGNYVFHDWSQIVIGSCTLEDCAATVLSTVVSAHPSEGRAVVDAGALALSKDAAPSGSPRTMGRIVSSGALDDAREIVSLSQEHGWAAGVFRVGERVRILPNHSCLVAACFDRAHAVRGDRLVDVWPIERGRDTV